MQRIRSQKKGSQYRLRAKSLALITTTLGTIGIAQTVHADVVEPVSGDSYSQVQTVVPDVNADSSAAHVQVMTQAQIPQKPAVQKAQAPQVNQQSTSSTVSDARLATASSSGNTAEPGTAVRQASQAPIGSQSTAQQPVPAQSVSTTPVQAASAVRKVQTTVPTASVHVTKAPTIHSTNSTPSIDYQGVVNAARIGDAINDPSKTDTKPAADIPTVTPVSVAVATSRTPKFTVAATTLSGAENQPVVANQQTPNVKAEGHLDLTTIRAADIAKVTPATNLISTTNPQALGQQVISNLASQTVGQNATGLLAQAERGLQVKTGYAAANTDQLGRTVKSQLMQLLNPVQTTALGAVDNATFDAATQKANQTYQVTGMPQVVTQSTLETEPTATTTNSVAQLLDPTGSARAASQLTSATTTAAAATKAPSLLGILGTQIQSALQSQLAPQVSADATAATKSATTPVDQSATPQGLSGVLASLGQLINPTNIFNSLAKIISGLTGGQGNPLTELSSAIETAASKEPQSATTGDGTNSGGSNTTFSDLINQIKTEVSKLLTGTNASNTLVQNAQIVLGNVSSAAIDLIQAVTGIQLRNVDWKKTINDFLNNVVTAIENAIGNSVHGGLNWDSTIQNVLGPIYDGAVHLIQSFSPSKVTADLGKLINLPSLSRIGSQAEELGKQILNFFGLPGLSNLLNQGSGKATESGSSFDILTNLNNTINNSIIGTLIGTLTNKQARTKATITWVDPNVTDRDKFLRVNGKLTTTPNPNYGKKLFAKGMDDPAYQAEDTGNSTDTSLNQIFGENYDFNVKNMTTQDHSATAPVDGSWELDGPDTMTPDHRYLTSVRIMPEVSGVASLANLNSATTSMRILAPYLLGQGTITSLAASDSQPLKDGFNVRGWSPIVAFDDATGYLTGPLQGGTWHSPLLDRSNGNFGVWVRIQYPTGVDARSMAQSIDWWSAVNVQQYTISAALGIIPVTLSDWSLEWMPRYTSWSAEDPNSIYFLMRGKKAGGADWNKIEHVDNVGGANIQETLDAILHPTSAFDVINAIKNFNFLTPQSDPIDGTMVPNGALGLWNSTNLALSAWNQIPGFAELGILYGVGNFSFNTHIDRYRGNYSTHDVAEILQAQGKIKNADDKAEVNAYRAQHPQLFYAVDDSEGKSMTKGTLPPSENGKLGLNWYVLDNLGYTRDPDNPNSTDVANAAMRQAVRDFEPANTTNNAMKTWHDYVDIDSDATIKLNRATDGSFTDTTDGGRTLALYGKTNPTASDKPIFSIRNFFDKLPGNGDTPIDRDVTQSYLASGLKTITVSTNASKASGNVGINGKPKIVPLSNLDADPGNLETGTKNVYDNVIHINGTALDGSSFLKTGDVPVEQTVNGTTIRNTTPQPGTMPSASTFPLKSLTQLSELKKGNNVTIQFKADEVDQDGKVISAGKWIALPDNLGTIKASGGYDPLSIPLDSLGLQNGHKYSISYQATDPYGFKTLVDKPTVIQVGQKQGYQLKYVDDSGNQLATSQFIASDNANEIVNPVDKVVTVPGYTLSSININGAPYEGGTISVPTKRNWTITYTYEKS